MSNGDITVISLVSGPHLIEDIGVTCVPGVLVTIPGAQTLISKDLHRGISSKALAVVPQPNPNLRVKALAEVTQLKDSLAQALTQSEALVQRNVFLETLCSELQVQVQGLKDEVATLEAKEGKLDAILAAVNKPQVVTQLVTAETPKNGLVHLPPSEVVGGEAPVFIPSTIKSDKVEGERVSVQEETSESSVSAAANKLRKLRNKQ